MGYNGWRTLTVMSPADLRIKGDAVEAEQEGEIRLIPLSQLHTILISNRDVTLSTALISKLSEANVSLIICNQKHCPSIGLVPFHHGSNDRLDVQMNWNSTQRNRVWMQILDRKLLSEQEMLQKYDLPYVSQLKMIRDEINTIDRCDFIEAKAAKYYFRALFGAGFRRRTDDSRNAALNYGYSIILSYVSRTLAAHGYHPAIGIHHANRQNSFNLSCDLMEPFRFAVDELVFCNPERDLDWEYRKELLRITQKIVIYGQKRMELGQAIECFCLDVLSAMLHPEKEIGEVKNAK